MSSTGENRYMRLKRRIYLVIFPILFFTNLSYWLFSPFVDSFMGTSLPYVCLFLALVWLLIYFNRFVRLCEIVSLGVFGFYHLVRSYSLTVELTDGVINVYALWFPIYYVYVFMVLDKKKALLFSALILLVTMAMGIPYFHDLRANDTLVQFYISSLVYILILFYFQRIVLSYSKLDMLKQSAYLDALTNIGNRRSVDAWLESEFKRCREIDGVFSVIYFDIDHFKEINDRYGHDIGDQVLMEFSSTIKKYIRAGDFFGRWGGEEFIIVSANNSLEEARQFAERLRQVIEEHPFRHVGHVTASFGVASLQPGDELRTLLKRADQALYSAKSSGRNRVRTAE